MSHFVRKTASIFFLLIILFVPLPFGFGSVQQQVTEFLFLKPVAFLNDIFFINSFTSIAFSSDTRSLNLLISLLALLAFIIAAFIKGASQSIRWLSSTATVYYLVFILFKYGTDKIFTAQFYEPNPNILYTPFGQLSKDILYWSTMGISPAYSIITGSIEVLAALLLLFRKTRIAGLLLSIFTFINIIIINFSFDISVKTFSVLLLFMALYILSPVMMTLYRFLILQKTENLSINSLLPVRPHIRVGMKFFVMGLVLTQALYPYLERKPRRSKLYGAYIVQQVFEGKASIPLNDFPVKRIFVHEKSYIIFQHHDDTMTDYYFEKDSDGQALVLRDYSEEKRRLPYRYTGDVLTIHLDLGRNVIIVAKKLDISKLPVLQDEFHFTIDELNKKN